MMSRRVSLFLPLFLFFTACGGGTDSEFDEFTFTAEDAAEISALLDQIESEQGGDGGTTTLEVAMDEVVLDVADAHKFDALRTSIGSLEENTFRVTNVFLNVRDESSVRSKVIEELHEGDSLKVLAFPDASWAKVELMDGRTGFVSTNYIAQVVSDKDLAAIQEKYKGRYEVDFRFLNVRSEPSAQGLKLGELTANQIVEPAEIKDEWARIVFDGKEGYVSTQYLKPYMPNVIVRQDRFNLPILRYRADEEKIADTLVQHLAFLQSQGRKLITLSDFYELLEQQEQQDVRLPEGSVLIVVTNVSAGNIRELADALRASDVQATVFVQTGLIGEEGIAVQDIQLLAAHGNDVQSAGHSAEDLRAMTNTQVQRELAQSRQILEDILGKDVFAIAYPAGGVNDRIIEQAIQTGYLFGLTVTPAVGEGIDRSQFLRMPSNLVTPGTTEQTLSSIVGIGE